ncbi:hypothetical protein D3C84_396920 [compost metagenome]
MVAGGIHQQRAGPGEGAHAIDMAIGHVAGDMVGVARQPDGFLHPQQAREDLLHLGLAHAGVAVGIEQYRFGGDQGALPVHMDGPALVGQRGIEALQAEAVEDAPRQAFVQLEGRLAAPGVEAPVDAGRAQARMADEARTGVAAPAVVDRQLDQFDVRPAQLTRPLDGGRVDHHLHRLEAGDGIGHAGEVDLHLGQGHPPAALPQGLVMGKGHPGGGVLYPLGGHDPAVLRIVELHTSAFS